MPILYHGEGRVVPPVRRGVSHPDRTWRWHRVPLSVPPARGTGGEEDAMEEQELVEETLVEEVSIDGMCGVY